ncbi:MAG TPA: hypothetical protein VFG20_18190 [Planctomycetaceae bacterium]|nr:hypothetical protein [Planctomycetaceae bacterium]
MSAETIRDLLQKRPFEPFVIRMTNGDIYQVRHPEVVILMKTKLILGDPDSDRSWILSLLHMAAIETLQTAS